MSVYRVEFRPYARQFQPPLQTNHGLWTVREGIILRLQDEQGGIGWGEIAPVPAFGSESMAEALAFCQSLSGRITADQVTTIPWPACRFGFEVAVDGGVGQSSPERVNWPCSVLLPTGEGALTAWHGAWAAGGRTLKWKIGVTTVEQELAWFDQLMAALPPDVLLRLDANGGLDWLTACAWLERCDRHPTIEFLEQPLPPGQWNELLQLSARYSTALALDESVATVDQLMACYQRGWRGIFVVKAAIAGSPDRLRQFCQTHAVDIVWSSVFETAIAQRYIQQRLIPSLPLSPLPLAQRALGFGVNHWFNDSLDQLDDESLWQTL